MTDDDIDLLHDDINKIKTAHMRKGAKKIRVRSSTEKARDDYKLAKKQHKARIKALKQSIKSHKLLIKQARNTYKLVKLTNK